MQIEARRLTDDVLGRLVRVDGETFLLGSFSHKKRTNFLILEEAHSDAETDTRDFLSISVNVHVLVEILD